MGRRIYISAFLDNVFCVSYLLDDLATRFWYFIRGTSRWRFSMQRQDSFCTHPLNLGCLRFSCVGTLSWLLQYRVPFRSNLSHPYSTLSSQWVLFNFNKPLPLSFSCILYVSVSGIFVHTYLPCQSTGIFVHTSLPCQSTAAVGNARQPPGICYELLRVWLIYQYIYIDCTISLETNVRSQSELRCCSSRGEPLDMCPWSSCLNVQRN